MFEYRDWETKATQKPKSKQAVEEEDEADEDDYENMTSKALYKLCCDRGISSQCKKRDKASLIAVLKANDGTANEDEDDWTIVTGKQIGRAHV